MIEVERVSVRYLKAHRPAVRGLTFHVEPGEVVGFLGPNGAGKTTTLRVLAGLLAADSGRARVCGFDLTKEAQRARMKLGHLPDDFGVPDGLSCREYLELFAALQHAAGEVSEARIDEVLELTGMRSRQGEAASGLSRGQRQRLGLARILLHRPDVLLLDEPASGLDPRARVEVRDILKRLGQEGKSVLVSSHVLADVAAACDSVVVLEAGRLQFRGTVDEAVQLCSEDLAPVVRVASLEGREASLRALGNDERLDLLEAPSGAGELLRVTPSTRWSGDSAAAAAFTVSVGEIIARAGLTLTRLEREAEDLETAFMRLTRGELA